MVDDDRMSRWTGRSALILRCGARHEGAVAALAVAVLVLFTGCSGDGETEGRVPQTSDKAQIAESRQADTTRSAESHPPDTSRVPSSAGEHEGRPTDRPGAERVRTGTSVEATDAEAAAADTGAAGAIVVDERHAPPGGSDESGLRVSRAYVCKGIEESEPTEAGRSFIPEGDGDLRLCCFSEVEGAGGRDTILHIWYWGDREMARVELSVRGPSFRTWSSKRIADEWKGEWHVDITDSSGRVLKRLEFAVE